MTIARPDRRLGRGDGDDQQGDDRRVALQRGDEGAEGDDRQVDGVEHQLDRHQHADGVAPGQEAEGADGEEQAGQDQVGVERVAHDRSSSLPAGLAAGQVHGRRPRPPSAARSRPRRAGRSRGRAGGPRRPWRSRRGPARRPGGRQDRPDDDRRAITAAADAATRAWVWKTSRLGAFLVWVSMMANRIRTLIAPM